FCANICVPAQDANAITAASSFLFICLGFYVVLFVQLCIVLSNARPTRVAHSSSSTPAPGRRQPLFSLFFSVVIFDSVRYLFLPKRPAKGASFVPFYNTADRTSTLIPIFLGFF
ncbi:MAG TPA: hypothetical protein PKZ55_02865, partial [Verrucomicrobiota bacterium]|nr:hypothetical protein [Verrucomicrobiota bacterium]HPO42006.1 hypothetical protein [Verrucomicrobiota bacterium]HPV92091.1 hypothetical protein [Verrucomicrobiota bacterium]HRD05728.1 hypothetical protein [Verrucomicrobiota bacterium]